MSIDGRGDRGSGLTTRARTDPFGMPRSASPRTVGKAAVKELESTLLSVRAEASSATEILTQEADALRAQLQRERQRFTAMEAVRLTEREELVQSYEAMLSEQASTKPTARPPQP